MSTEEDTELRDLVAQALENNGCLAKIRAQLRASIFLTLDEDEELQKKQPLLNKKIKTQLESEEGRTLFCLVREFLAYFDLNFTISVFEAESYFGSQYKYDGRAKLVNDVGISLLEENSSVPLLQQIIQIAQSKVQTKNITINLSQIQNENYNNCGSPIEHSNNEIELNSEEERSKSDANQSNASHLSESVESSNDSRSGLASKARNLNETFHVNSPIITSAKLNSISSAGDCKNNNKLQEVQQLSQNQQINSLSEKSLKGNLLIDLDKSLQATGPPPQIEVDRTLTLLDQTVIETEFSPPILKETKPHKYDTSLEKLKLSPQKTEKLKTKTSLTSLADLPPLQMNKTRVNETMLLPSLYSKEFKEKSALKDLDKFLDADLDSLDNYEEDFMSGTEADLVLNKNDFLSAERSKINLLEELHQTCNEIVEKQNMLNFLNKNVVEGKEQSKLRSFVTDSADNEKGECDTSSAIQGERQHSSASSVTSEDFEINSNSDVLNLSGSN